jgi:hypothetical protein
MERFVVSILSRVINIVILLAFSGGLLFATQSLHDKTQKKLKTGLISLRSVQGQLNGR